MSEELEEVTLSASLILYPEDSEEISVRQIAFGSQPLALIEPNDDGDGFIVTASLITQEELADVLEMLVNVLRNGEESVD